ncbi:hypothetical protein KXW36_000461, partial [Aspergillus fumigatus]
IRGLLPRLLQLRRPEQGAAVQDHRGDDDGLCARGGRTGLDHGTIAADLRQHRAAQRVRLPDRRDRPVRDRRDPADDGRGPRIPRRQCQHQPACRAADLARTARLLDDLAALLPDRLLDGRHPRGGDAGLLHELRHRQAAVAPRQQFRQGRDRGRDRTGDGGTCRRHRGAAADAVARRARLADGG